MNLLVVRWGDADDFEILPVEGGIIVEIQLLTYGQRLDSVLDHRMGMDDLLGTDVFHDGNMHFLLERVGNVGFGIIEVFRHLGQGQVVLEMLFDVIGDFGDDGYVVVLVG